MASRSDCAMPDPSLKIKLDLGRRLLCKHKDLSSEPSTHVNAGGCGGLPIIPGGGRQDQEVPGVSCLDGLVEVPSARERSLMSIVEGDGGETLNFRL